MKHLAAVLVTLVLSIAFANREHELLTGFAGVVANDADLVVLTCPEGIAVAHAACLIGTGSVDLDKRILDLYVPRWGSWGSAWISVNASSFGRAVDVIGVQESHVMIFQSSPHVTLVIFWIPAR